MCCFVSISAVQADTSEQAKFEQEAKAVIKEFAGTLKSTLIGAMQNGGPVNAISVCREVAPSIAEQLSKKYALSIRRTSTKTRNPANQADEWETSVLNKFSTRLMTGEAIQKLVFSEKVENEHGADWRFMKAIPTDKLCLTCHGTQIVDPVKKKLAEYYPDDLATGYRLGDIRGAFSVRKPIKSD